RSEVTWGVASRLPPEQLFSKQRRIEAKPNRRPHELQNDPPSHKCQAIWGVSVYNRLGLRPRGADPNALDRRSDPQISPLFVAPQSFAAGSRTWLATPASRLALCAAITNNARGAAVQMAARYDWRCSRIAAC